MPIFFPPNQILRPEKCWNDWIEQGSLTKVKRKYRMDGLISPRTGDAPNESAIQKSAYSYAVENVDIAKERFIHECQTRGIPFTEELWEEKLYKIGRLLYYQRSGRMADFIEKHGLHKYAQHD
jgi:hypothetical protein